MRSNYLYLLKGNIIQEMRRYTFLLIMGITLFLGYALIPAASDGYEVFYIKGVRGIYNSHWLGAMVAMLSTMLLWLFGFYMLRSKISEDQRLKMGQIIASTPIRNLRYISSRASSNFCVLMIIELVLVVAFMGMQLLRGEDLHINLAAYLLPLLFVSIPSLLLLSAFTVLFDVFPGLKGAVGNVLFFAIWIFLSVMSISNSSSLWDVFGINAIQTGMTKEAAAHFDFISANEIGGSIGYYPIEGRTPTFEWSGVDWTGHLLTSRLIWVVAAMFIILLSSQLFNRFAAAKTAFSVRLPAHDMKNKVVEREERKSYQLSPVKRDKRVRLSRLVRAEFRIMLKGMSIWWYLLVLGSMVASLLVPLDQIKSWLPILMLWPLAIWSQMGNREFFYSTNEILLSSCPRLYKFFSVWIAGILVTLLISSGVLIHFFLEGELTYIYSWVVGLIFVPTLALTLGTMTRSRKLFEVLYMLLWYLGPVNDLPYLNFLGLPTSYATLYIVLTLVLLVVGIMIQHVQEGNLMAGFRKNTQMNQSTKGEYHGKMEK
ncbi:UNVERIFIED_CONTAM: hypothetical protein ABIC26_000286 [Paenibacillus sp. PvR008]